MSFWQAIPAVFGLYKVLKRKDLEKFVEYLTTETTGDSE